MGIVMLVKPEHTKYLQLIVYQLSMIKNARKVITWILKTGKIMKV